MPIAAMMYQSAPYPVALDALVKNLTYKPGWWFKLKEIDRGQFCQGLTLVITVATQDSYPPHEEIRVEHYMPVLPGAYDERAWRRWLFDQILLVERHEACEFFTIGGDKPYAPSHGPGNDPYTIREIGTDEDRRMSSRGELEPKEQ